MTPRCKLCGQFMKKITDGIGMPTLTNSPPDRPRTTGTILFSPFGCDNPSHNQGVRGLGHLQYHPVGFATLSQPPQRHEHDV